MRDVVVVSSGTQQYDLDINIVDGVPEYLESADETIDQRAALAAYIGLNTIPGRLSDGIDWGALQSGEASYVDITNQISQQIQNYVGQSEATVTYTPVIIPQGDKVQLKIVRS